MCSPSIEKLGATPANIQWTVVRGDTATLRVDFLEDDEVTAYDTGGWTFSASAYDPAGDFIDELVVESYDDGTVFIIASQDITANWGISKYKPIVAELRFDLTATIPGDVVSGGGVNDETIWTPVIGTICVLGDVSGTL
jgi:hypothetical protein